MKAYPLVAAVCFAILFAVPGGVASIIFSDTFDIGAPPTRNDDPSDSLDLQFYENDKVTLSITADPVINSGNALSADNASDFGFIVASFPTHAIDDVNEALALSFDFRRFTVDTSGGGTPSMRVGLYNDTGTPVTNDGGNSTIPQSTDDIGYMISLGVDQSNAGVSREAAGGTGGILGGGTEPDVSIGIGSGPGFAGFNSTSQSYAVDLMFTGTASGVNIAVDVDGTNVIDVTDTAAPITIFNEIGFGIGTTGWSYDYRVDNVRLEFMVVPEPSTCALFTMMAITPLLALRSRRKF